MASPVSAAPCRFDQSASSTGASQIRRDGRRASARSTSASAGKSASEKSWERIATIAPKAAGITSDSATTVERSPAPRRRASSATRQQAIATAMTWAACSPRAPPIESSQPKMSSASTGTLCQPRVGALANGTPSGMLPRAVISCPSAASQRASAATAEIAEANAVTIATPIRATGASRSGAAAGAAAPRRTGVFRIAGRAGARGSAATAARWRRKDTSSHRRNGRLPRAAPARGDDSAQPAGPDAERGSDV